MRPFIYEQKKRTSLFKAHKFIDGSIHTDATHRHYRNDYHSSQ